MMVVRNRLSSLRAGGPRQAAELRDRFIIGIDSESRGDVISELDRLDLKARSFNNIDGLVVRPRHQFADVLERLRQIETDGTRIRQAVDEVSDQDGVIDATSSVVRATSELSDAITAIPEVVNFNFVRTYADFGPENLRVSVSQMDAIDTDRLAEEDRTLEDLNELLGLRRAWENYGRGDGTIVAVFDTAYDPDLFDDTRIVSTWHGEDVDSVYDSSEGHGTMCAGAAVAQEGDDIPFNGTAPEASIILVRITDDEGQIRGDYIAEAWDWLINLSEGEDRPIISNHSYGTPICTGRPRAQFCNTPVNDLVKEANSRGGMIACYAAGNEAGHCGRRPSGITNAITGTNSLSEVITVGAARFDLRDAQEYSSHGRGDCAPIADPKPNVCCALPHKIYYSDEDGWKIRDASKGIGGSVGGTSHASPSVAGKIALIQSRSLEVNDRPLQTEEMKQIIHEAAEPPRRTQINITGGIVGARGYDARFGYGQIDINEALEMV